MLRNGMNLDEEWEELKKSIDAVLVKLPKYEGTVYRSLDSGSIKDLENFWTRYAPGKIVPENAYTSASTSVYDESMEIQMIIECKTGRDMRAYNSKEQEILFERGTRFLVVKREGNTLWLREI